MSYTTMNTDFTGTASRFCESTLLTFPCRGPVYSQVASLYSPWSGPADNSSWLFPSWILCRRVSGIVIFQRATTDSSHPFPTDNSWSQNPIRQHATSQSKRGC